MYGAPNRLKYIPQLCDVKTNESVVEFCKRSYNVMCLTFGMSHG